MFIVGGWLVVERGGEWLIGGSLPAVVLMHFALGIFMFVDGEGREVVVRVHN